MIVDTQSGMLHCSTYTEWLRLVKHVFNFCKQDNEVLVFESQDNEHMLITSFVVKENGEKYTLGSFAHQDDFLGHVYCFNGALVKTNPYNDEDEKKWRKEFLKNFTLQY